MTRPGIVVVAVAAIVALVVVAARSGGRAPAPPEARTEPGPATPSTDGTPAGRADGRPATLDPGRTAEPETPDLDLRSTEPDDGELARFVRMPDGTWLPALNGVTGVDPILWEPGRPYAPVVGVERLADGFDWYVHADGTRTTTRSMWRPDLGREDPTALTQHPRDVGQPVEVLAPGVAPAGAPGERR